MFRRCLGLALFTACAGENDLQNGAEAVARLTVVNAAALAQVVSTEATCGFASATAQTSAQLQGAPGENGQVTFTITDCAIDLDQVAPTTDCNGNSTRLAGQVRVSGQLILRGLRTDDPAQPIIPSGQDDASTLILTHVAASGFEVRTQGVPGALTIREGSLSATLQPRLAKSAQTGLCTVPTPNLEVVALELWNASLFVAGDGESSSVFVPTAQLVGAVGQVGEAPNRVRGVVSIFGQNSTVDLPLDPDFDPATFSESYACTPDLALPESYTCGVELAPEQSLGIGRLSVQTVAILTNLLANDTRCGFRSAGVLANARLQGSDPATTLVLDTTCTIDIGERKELLRDCGGTTTFAQGRATVRATQFLTGRATQNPRQPVLPENADATKIVLHSIALDRFGIDSNGAGIQFGRAVGTATVSPRLARSQENGLCTLPTPLAQVALQLEGQAAVATGTTSVRLPLAANLTARIGLTPAGENQLEGSLILAGANVAVPTSPLIPNYSRAAFDATWACTPGLATPEPLVCDPKPALGAAAARLTPRLLGALVAHLERSGACGLTADPVVGVVQLGTEGTATNRDPDCVLRFPNRTLVASDCLGNATFLEGEVRLAAERTITGFLVGTQRPVLPTRRDPIRWTLDLDGELTVSTSQDDTTLTVNGGLQAVVLPRLALDTTTGACSLPTPIAQFSDIQYTNARLSLGGGGNELTLQVTTSDFEANAGPAAGGENTLAGTITFEGAPVSVAGDLDPGYDPLRFSEQFECDPNLALAPSDAACSFRGVLAPLVARGLVESILVTTTELNQDTTCGFASLSVLATGQAQGNVGQPGSVRNRVPACALSHDAPFLVAEDCLGEQRLTSGTLDASGTRTTVGLRTEQCAPGGCIQLAAPLSPEAVELVLALRPNGFTVTRQEIGQAPSFATTLISGTLSATVTPLLGERASMPGLFDRPTPVSQVQATATNTEVVLFLPPGAFRVTVDQAELDARVGLYQGQGNTLEGQLSVDGQQFPLSLGPLDPNFQSSRFDRSYACTPDLRGPVP